MHLNTPALDSAIRSLKRGDVVYLTGTLYTAREGGYRQAVEKGAPFPEALQALTNVNFHSSPAAAERHDGGYVIEAVMAMSESLLRTIRCPPFRGRPLFGGQLLLQRFRNQAMTGWGPVCVVREIEKLTSLRGRPKHGCQVYVRDLRGHVQRHPS